MGVSRPFGALLTINGRKCLTQDHALSWSMLQQMDPKLLAYDHAYFPRGHVEWREDGARFIYLLDEKLKLGAFVAQIILDWRTPRDRLSIYSNFQYRSVARVGPPRAP